MDVDVRRPAIDDEHHIEFSARRLFRSRSPQVHMNTLKNLGFWRNLRIKRSTRLLTKYAVFAFAVDRGRSDVQAKNHLVRLHSFDSILRDVAKTPMPSLQVGRSCQRTRCGKSSWRGRLEFNLVHGPHCAAYHEFGSFWVDKNSFTPAE